MEPHLPSPGENREGGKEADLHYGDTLMLIYITNHFLVYPDKFCRNIFKEEKDLFLRGFNLVLFLKLH